MSDVDEARSSIWRRSEPLNPLCGRKFRVRQKSVSVISSSDTRLHDRMHVHLSVRMVRRRVVHTGLDGRCARATVAIGRLSPA